MGKVDDSCLSPPPFVNQKYIRLQQSQAATETGLHTPSRSIPSAPGSLLWGELLILPGLVIFFPDTLVSQ